MKFILPFLLMVACSVNLFGQVSTYSFSSTVGTYTDITGGTVLIDGTSYMDSWVSSAITIPSFTFNNVTYTTAYVTSNGQISLGGTAPSTTTYTGISTGVGSGITICPFSADLNRANTTAATEIRWEVVGNDIIFQWKEVQRYNQTENFSMQVHLNTVTGIISFVYQLNSGPGGGTSYQPQVGIRTSATDYNNRLVGTGTETWVASLPGTSNTDKCRFTSAAPAQNFVTGLTYIWTPPTCPAPTNLTATNITTTTADLGWTENGSATTWNIEYGAPGFTLGTGTPINGTTTNPHNLTGLTANTDYEYYVQTYCGVGDLSIWVGPFAFTTECNVITTMPYTETFNSSSTTESCWRVLNENGDGDTWNMDYTTNPYEGNECAVIYTDGNSGANDDYLISPKITLTGNERLVFYYRVQSSGEPNDFEVLLSTTTSDPASFTTTLLPNTSYSNITYMEQMIYLSAYSGDVYIAFHVPNGGLDGWRLYIDQVTIETNPACPDPSALTATYITSTTADLGWTENGSATTWNIEVVTAGSTPTGTATQPSVTTNPYTYSGLTANTDYEYYVQSDCGGDISGWVGPFAFSTPCDLITAFPYTEGFEGGVLPTCWSNPDGNYTIGVESNTGSYCMRASYLHSGEAILVSPDFALPADYQIEFYWKDDDINTSKVANHDTTFFEISNNFGSTWIILDTLSSASSMSTYQQEIHYLSAYAGSFRFRFRDKTDATSSAYGIGIDDITIDMMPACPPPSDLTATNITSTSADLGWTENGSATTWNIEVGAPGFTPGTGTQLIGEVGTTSNPWTASGASPNTTYEFYVQADCGGSGASTWVGPYQATTLCGAISVMPHTETFNSSSTSEICWTVLNENGDGDTWNMDNTSNPYEGDQCARIYTDYNAGANDDYLISPQITLTGNERLVFQYRVETTHEPNDFEVLLSTTTPDPASFTTTLLPNAFYNNTTYMERMIYLSAYTGDVYIAFHVPSGGLDGYYLYIDQVTIETIPTCPDPSYLTATGVTQTTADLGWTENGSATTWNIELGPAGFTPTGTPTMPGVTANPYTYTSLAAGTYYDYYVQSDCGGSSSNWVGPYTFMTPCSAITTFPWYEDFENAGNMPSCWLHEYNYGTQDWLFQDGDNNVLSAYEGSYNAAFTHNATGTSSYLITPELDLTSLSYPRLSFMHAQQVWGGDQDTLRVYYKTSPAGAWTMIPGAEWTNSMSTWTTATFDLPNPSATYYIGFMGIDGYGRGVVIDSVVVKESPVLAWSGLTFIEAAANDGSIETVINLTLTNDVFAATGLMTAATHYTVANVPAGLTVEINATSTTTATVTLTGNATSHANVDDISNMEITFLDAAFTLGTAIDVTGYSQTALAVDFYDPGAIVMINEVDADQAGTDAAEFVELYDGGVGNSSLNGYVVVFFNGATDVSYAAYDLDGYTTDVDGYFVIGNTGVTGASITFADNTLQNGADAVALYMDDATSFPTGTAVTLTNLVDAVVYDTDDADDAGLLTLLNSGQPQIDEAGFGNSTVHSCSRIPNGTGGLRNTDTYEPALPTPGAVNSKAPTLSWDVTTFVEAVANDGSISTIVNLTLTDETFATTGVLTATTHYTVANVPTGLTVEINATSTTTATVTLTGNAASHTNADDISNMEITFVDAAFTGSNAAAVIDYEQTGLVVDFMDPAVLTWDVTTFVEAAANDGSISTIVNLTLANETFATTGALTASEFTSANVPAGLTVEINATSTTAATVSLTGNATNHTDADDISNLEITFLDGAFTGGVAANVTDYTQTALVVDFMDPTPVTDLDIIMPYIANYGCDMTGQDTVPICIKNVGNVTIPAGDTIFIYYEYPTSVIVEDTLELWVDLLAGDTVCYEFDQTVDFSSIGVHDFTMWIYYEYDEEDSNDTLIGTFETYELTVDLGGVNDTLEVTAYPTTLDAGTCVAPGPFTCSYLWSTNEVTQTINVNADGWYGVTVSDDNGCEAEDSVYVVLNTSIAESTEFGVNVYPNPNKGIFTVELFTSASSESIIELMNIQGQSIEIRKTTGNSIVEMFDVSELAKGIYYLRINSGSAIQVEKIIIE